MWNWSKIEREGIARFIMPQASSGLDLPEGRLEIIKRGGRLALVEAIYNSLREKGIKYVNEPYNPAEQLQPIRSYAEIFNAPGEGTCLDLALLFCGLCLGNDLLPILIVVKGHALAAVSLNHDLRDWNSITRSERQIFDKLLVEPGQLLDLINSESYIAVECTGFARSFILPETVPEGVGRGGDGTLSFERAKAAGREQFDRADRPFSFALDSATAHFGWRIDPLNDDGFDIHSFQIYQDYRKRLTESLSAPNEALPNPKYYFNLTFQIQNEILPVESLIAKTIDKTRLILQGYAGGGKSANLVNIVNRAWGDNYIPILINLKKWTLPDSDYLRALAEEHNNERIKFDALLKASLVDLTCEKIDVFPANIPKIILVDGLNEVDGRETRNNILAFLDGYVRTSLLTYALVTDRRVETNSYTSKWTIAELNPLDSDEVRSHIDSKFDAGTYSQLSEKALELLRIPYFLDYALESNNLRLESAAKTIETFFMDSFFIKEGNINEAGLNNLAEAAFNAYAEFKSTSFDVETFRKWLDNEELWEHLIGSGVIRMLEAKASFDHQLKHDYLASRHLAQDKKIWNSTSFDAVTLEAKNLESLLMTLEQLPGENQGDEFVRKLYDWNWAATVMFVTEALKLDEKLCSKEMIIIVLSVVAEKLFDPIQQTRERAEKQLESFSGDIGDSFRQAESLNDVIQLVKNFESNENWFLEWKSLFIRLDAPPINEPEIRLITSEDAIKGWTAANVIKRFKLNESDLRQLRAIYDAHDTQHDITNRHRDAVQWRVLHALGTSDDAENVNLLIRALNGKGYHWAKYGAGRSLIEIAAITSNNKLRECIVQQLQASLNNLESKVIVEICQAAQYRNAPDDWVEVLKPLMSVILATPNLTKDDKERILPIVETFIENEPNEQ
ncbi:MAG: hypothetical protein WA584_17650 [Pyrinomonadaceae bacterium]